MASQSPPPFYISPIKYQVSVLCAAVLEITLIWTLIIIRSNYDVIYCWLNILRMAAFIFGFMTQSGPAGVHTHMLWLKFIEWCQANGMLNQRLDWSCQALVTHRYQSVFYQMDHVCRGWWLQNVVIGDCSAQWMLSPSLSTKYSGSSPVLVPTVFFYRHAILFLYHCLNLLSSISTPSLSNVECYPSFF